MASYICGNTSIDYSIVDGEISSFTAGGDELVGTEDFDEALKAFIELRELNYENQRFGGWNAFVLRAADHNLVELKPCESVTDR